MRLQLTTGTEGRPRPRPMPPHPSKKKSASAVQTRARLVSDILNDAEFMPGYEQKERFSSAQKMLSAASAALGSSNHLKRLS